MENYYECPNCGSTEERKVYHCNNCDFEGCWDSMLMILDDPGCCWKGQECPECGEVDYEHVGYIVDEDDE